MPALNDLRAAIIGDRAAAVPFPFLFLPDLLSLVRGSRFVPRICSIRRSIPTGCSHPPTRWAVARRKAWAYISLSRRARMQRSSYDLTVAFPFAEGSAAEKLLTKGCRNSARMINGIPTAAGNTQNAVWGNLFQSGRFLPLST